MNLKGIAGQTILARSDNDLAFLLSFGSAKWQPMLLLAGRPGEIEND